MIFALMLGTPEKFPVVIPAKRAGNEEEGSPTKRTVGETNSGRETASLFKSTET